MRNSYVGFIVLFAKLGPKILPILYKLADALWGVAKSLVGIKGAGLAGSVGLYAYLFTWQMGVALVVFIAIHEYGHLWAMKRCGIKTKGMFFIPGFGAVAVADENFGSARNEAYIAIMGPIFGLVGFVLPLLLCYWMTGNALWAAIAGFTTFINLVNLLPIHPLDGGRILKALFYSRKVGLSLVLVVVISLATAVLGVTAGFLLLAWMALIGLYELAREFGVKNLVADFLRSGARVVGAVFGVFLGFFWYRWMQSDEYERYISGVSKTELVYLILMTAGVAIAAFADVATSTAASRHGAYYYPATVIRGAISGVKQVWWLRNVHIMPIENYEWMRIKDKVWYTFWFLALILVHVAIILALASVPGAELAKELLK